MASSKVSCMLVSLLLLVLVLSDVDKALGEPIQLHNRKLTVTEHHDQVTTEQRLAIFSKNWWKNPKVQKQLEKFADLAGEIPLPPSSPGSNDGVCLNSLRTLNKVYNMLKAQCKNTTANVCKRKLKMVKPAFDSFKAKCYPSPSRSSKGKNI